MIDVIDGKPFIRSCRSIPADGNGANEWIVSPSAMYEKLTKLLPLAGASALTLTRPGREPRIATTLRGEAPWLGGAIDLIAEQAAMSLWTGKPWLSLKPLLLVGPPGAGKTHFARRLGELSGCGDAVLGFCGRQQQRRARR